MSKHELAEELDDSNQAYGEHHWHRENAVPVAALLAAAVREGRRLWVEWGDNDRLVGEDEAKRRTTDG